MGNVIRSDHNQCPICGTINIDIFTTESIDFCYKCPCCGPYFAKQDWYHCFLRKGMAADGFNLNKLQSYLFYHKSDKRPFIAPSDFYSKLDKAGWVDIYNLTPEMVEAWYPKTFAEKIDIILLYLYKKMSYWGEKIEVTYLDLLDIFLIDHSDVNRNVDLSSPCPKKYKDQIDYINSYLVQSKYLANFAGSHVNGVKWESKECLQLTVDGLSRVDNFQKSQVHNKKVFIAMSFNPAINNIYNAIVAAITQAECEVVSMKSRIHNKQIVPEMLRLIKESKILVMDISEPNFGAYYEAGYAQGMGKEVVFTCKSDVMKKDKFPCSDNYDKECDFLKKYSKPHFDIAQKQILVWEDEADLTKQLTEWIKFLMG